MKILVTGSAGFLGHHFVQDIQDRHQVVALCSYRDSGNLNRLVGIANPGVKVLYHDLSCELSQHLTDQIGQVDAIVHMAAQPHVDKATQDPRNTVMSNTVGTLNILEFARAQKDLKHFIYFSTDEVFGPAGPDDIFDEYARYNSTNVYSASKAGGEELASAYYYTFKLPITIVHSMNMFGERQQREAFIPIAIRKCLEGDVLKLHVDDHGNTPGRHYMYVKDVTRGVKMLLSRGHVREERVPKYSMGGAPEQNVHTIAYKIAENLNSWPIIEQSKTDRLFVDTRYSLSYQRMTDLGWKVEHDFDARLAQVCSFYSNNRIWL